MPRYWLGCTQAIHNDPINQPLTGTKGLAAELGDRDVETYYDDMVVAVSFSGGGMRAAAFSFGVSSGFDETQVTTAASTSSLADRIDFVSGVSGGSVLAAYYGLKKRQALADFKQRFLLQNAEEGLQTDLSLTNIARGLQGGINDSTQFPRWLDAHLFDHATFKSLLFAAPAASLDQRLRYLQPHAVRVRPRDLWGAVQRSCDLSGLARCCCVRCGAGGVRAGRHSELSRRLPDPVAGLGPARARQ